MTAADETGLPAPAQATGGPAQLALGQHLELLVPERRAPDVDRCQVPVEVAEDAGKCRIGVGRVTARSLLVAPVHRIGEAACQLSSELAATGDRAQQIGLRKAAHVHRPLDDFAVAADGELSVPAHG